MHRLHTTRHAFAHSEIGFHIGRGGKCRTHNASLNRAHQFGKHFKGFALVFHQRITLTITAQAHATTQIIHRRQELLPFFVNRRQADHAFQHRQGFRNFTCTLGQIRLFHASKEFLRRLFRLPCPCGTLFYRAHHREVRHPLHQGLGRSVLCRRQQRHTTIHNHVIEDVQNAFMRRVGLHQNLLTQSVDDRTLLVHHIVILQGALTNREVLLFHLTLGAFHRVI